MRELPTTQVEAYSAIEELKAVTPRTEAERLQAYQSALSQLGFAEQISKMNAIDSPENIKRFLSADAPENLVARFLPRMEEINLDELTPEERERIGEIHIKIQRDLEKYLQLAETSIKEEDLSMLLLEIHRGKTKLHIALGLIEETNNDKEAATTSYRNAINAGHNEGYSMLTRYYIKEEDLRSAQRVVEEALENDYTLPAMDLAFQYLMQGKHSRNFCRQLLKMADPKDTRQPAVILMDHAIRTSDFERIDELLEFAGAPEHDLSMLTAASLLYAGYLKDAINNFELGLEESKSTYLLDRLNEILTNRKNDEGLNLYHAQVFMAEVLKATLDAYGLPQLGNHLVNQTKH